MYVALKEMAERIKQESEPPYGNAEVPCCACVHHLYGGCGDLLYDGVDIYANNGEDCPLMDTNVGAMMMARWAVKQVAEALKPYANDVKKVQKGYDLIVQDKNRDKDAYEEALYNLGVAKYVFIGAYLCLVEAAASDEPSGERGKDNEPND